MPKPATLEAYLDELSDDRRESIERLRAVINDNIGSEYEEGIQYGMPSWYLPHSVYPHGYHCDPKQPLPFASVASQKKHIGIYLFCVYLDAANQEKFVEDWRATGKRLDMGKGCVRVRSADEVPLDVLAKAVRKATAKRVIETYEANLPASVKAKRERAAAKAAAADKPNGTSKKAAKKKAARKKAGSKKVTKKASRKATTKKAPTKKTTAKKTTAKKPAAKKTTAKKPLTKKAARKTTTRKKPSRRS